MFRVQPLITQINSSKLKETLRDKAIDALIRLEHNRGANFTDDFETLAEAFTWERTVEGKEFWEHVNTIIYK